jgi:hypothetical protein
MGRECIHPVFDRTFRLDINKAPGAKGSRRRPQRSLNQTLAKGRVKENKV